MLSFSIRCSLCFLLSLDPSCSRCGAYCFCKTLMAPCCWKKEVCRAACSGLKFLLYAAVSQSYTIHANAFCVSRVHGSELCMHACTCRHLSVRAHLPCAACDAKVWRCASRCEFQSLTCTCAVFVCSWFVCSWLLFVFCSAFARVGVCAPCPHAAVFAMV